MLVHLELTTIFGLPRKGKSVENKSNHQTLSLMAQNDFKSLFLDILAADNAPLKNPWFTITQCGGSSIRRLSSATCGKLEKELQKAASERTVFNIPTASLMQLQGICMSPLKTLEPWRELNEDLEMIIDILSSTRVALLTIALKVECFATQLEEILSLCLRVLSSILFETREALSIVSRTEIWNQAARTLKEFDRIVTKVGVDLILAELEELALRIVQPSY